MFFQFLSTITVNIVDKCKVVIYVLFYMSSTKNTISWGFQPEFSYLVKSKMMAKMATVIGDVTGLQ